LGYAKQRAKVGEVFERQISVKNQKNLAGRNANRQFHAGKYHHLQVIGNHLAVRPSFFGGGFLDVREKANIMMVGDRNRMQSLLTARTYERGCVFVPLICSYWTIASPIAIARAVNLEVAAMEVGAFVHLVFPLPMYQTLARPARFYGLCAIASRMPALGLLFFAKNFKG
jgi:hypothetical protein